MFSPVTNQSRYQQYKKVVYDHYGSRCNCCGESNPKFLTVDHVNNDGYTQKTKKGFRRKGNYMYQQIIKDNFPDHLQILCWNCNCGKNLNGGICPHKKS
jgi:predicted restriction endonuclease